jgi:hypothetical protein
VPDVSPFFLPLFLYCLGLNIAPFEIKTLVIQKQKETAY